jgi:fructose-specific phosphotransferase system IIC component
VLPPSLIFLVAVDFGAPLSKFAMVFACGGLETVGVHCSLAIATFLYPFIGHEGKH